MSSKCQPGAALSRRRFLRGSALLLGFVVGDAVVTTSPAQARARGLPLTSLSAAQAAALEVIGEAMVPGAREAGLVHYVDQQLGADTDQNLLMLKYLGIAPTDHPAFYRQALDNIETASRQGYSTPATELSPAQATGLITDMAGDALPGWIGAPASLCYFALRADSVDVVYGTTSGMAALDLPTMYHIEAPTAW